MPDIKLSPPTPLPFDVFVVPGSHFDLGWVLNPDGSLALGDHIIHEAIELIRSKRPEFRFTIEYVLFLRHFLETFPDHRSVVKEMLDDGRLEVCATVTGAMEQIFDGETLVRQLTHGIRWMQKAFDYTPRCAQHTDLPGHTIQMPQILARCGIPFIAYSRYRPPCPLHWWEAPDGSRVLACNHVQHYEWGRVLRQDLAFAEEHLCDYLRDELPRLWPARQVLMPEERDLDWVEPAVCDTVKQWNESHGDLATLRFTLLREFFEAVETDRLPTYRGEAPYGFYSIPAFEPQTYQQGRRSEHLLAAAERFALARELEGLGHIDPSRLDEGWEHLFWPHDHNFGGQDGPVNDAVRLHRAVHAGFIAESALREIDASYLLHVKSDPQLGKAFLVFNPLSWSRSDVVELLMELPGPQVDAVEVLDDKGNVVPTQLLSLERADEERIDYQLDDADLAEFQARVALVAEDVPPVGYKTFHVRKTAKPQAPHNRATPSLLENDHWRVELDGGRIMALTCRRTNRVISRQGGDFGSLVALEDLRGSLEDGYDPWDPRDNPPNYTGREWMTELDSATVQVLEHGPARTRLEVRGRLLDCPVVQEIELSESLDRIILRTSIDWAGHKNRQVRLRLPFAMNDPKVTYETPFGSVVVGHDEMENTYRGDGTRWVQKWIDLSEPGFGVAMSAGCCAINFDGATISPLLVSTTYCRGDAYYWMHNRGRHTFSFALRTHDGDAMAARHYGIGWEGWLPLRVVRGQPRLVGVEHRACLPTRRSYLGCDHPGLVVSAFKPACDGRGHIVRVFNVTGEPVSDALRFGFAVRSACRCDMDEQPGDALTHGTDTLPISLGPFEIATFRVELSPSD